MSKPPFIIVNPMAANGRVGQQWPSLRERIEAILGPVEFGLTESPEHTSVVARQALRDGYRDLASLGGDGTHSLVVNGFFEEGRPVAEDATLSILPAGTGGDFKRMLSPSEKGLEGFVALMAKSEATRIDAGHISFVGHDGEPASRHFINIASFGMSGLVDQLVNSTTKALGGKASYFIASFRAWLRYRPPTVRLTVDGEALEPTSLFVAGACNGQYFGGGMHFGPHADLTDGSLDLVVMPYRSRLSHLIRGGSVYQATHLGEPGVYERRAREIRAESDQTCLLDIDGEAPGRLPATIRVVPGALKLKGLAMPSPQTDSGP